MGFGEKSSNATFSINRNQIAVKGMVVGMQNQRAIAHALLMKCKQSLQVHVEHNVSIQHYKVARELF